MIQPPLLLSKKFFHSRSVLKQRRVPLRNYWTLWDKKIAGNRDIPFLCVNFFHNRFFLKHRSVALQFFLVLWDKKFDKNLWNNPSSLIYWSFRYQKVFGNTEGFFNDLFRYGETKQFLRKIVVPACSLIPNIFRYQKFSKTQKSFSTNVSVAWDGNLLTEIVNILPPPTYP